MPFNRTQVSNVRDALDRALAIDFKADRVAALSKLDIDENEDFAITNASQVMAYVAAMRVRRDNIINAIQPVVAGWS